MKKKQSTKLASNSLPEKIEETGFKRMVTQKLPKMDFESLILSKLENQIPLTEEEKLKDTELQKSYGLKRQKSIEQNIANEEQFKRLITRINDDENIVCLSVDGHETAEFAFNVVVTEFMPKLKSSLVCTYIYNLAENLKYNWRQQKEFVIDKFNTLLVTKIPKKKGNLIIQDTDKYYVHPIAQVNKISKQNKCNFLFIGYNGLKTGNYKADNLKKGLSYLLAESIFPTILIKEEYLRGINNKGYKWLFILDTTNPETIKVFDYFLPLIELKIDVIFGLTLIPKNSKNDIIKKEFDAEIKKIGINQKNVIYQTLPYEKGKFVDVIKEFVNKNEDHSFEYVVIYNNPDKSKVEKENGDSQKLVQHLSTNICFVNGIYIERMKFKQMEEEQKKRIEELNKK